MDFIRRLQAEFTVLSAQLPTYILLFLGAPFLVVLFFGFIFTTMFSADLEISPQPTYIVDEAANEESKLLVSVLEGETFEDLFELVEEQDDADFTIKIPEVFSLTEDQSEVTLIKKSGSSNSGGIIVQEALATTLNTFRQQTLESKVAAERGLAQGQVTELQAQLAEDLNAPLMVAESHRGEGAYTSYEYYSLFSIWIILLTVWTTAMASENSEKLTGLRKRDRLFPTTMAVKVVSSVVVIVLISTIFALIYILITRFLFGAFSGPLYNYLIVFAAQAALYSSFASLMGNLLPERITMVINSVFYLLIMFVGGMIPLDRMLGYNPVPEVVKEFIEQLSAKPYFSIHNGHTEFMPSFIVICLVIAIVAMVGSILIGKLRKEH